MLHVSQSPPPQVLQVPDKSLAAVFYGEGLGLTADPGSTAAQRGGVGVTWFNIGRQQVSGTVGDAWQLAFALIYNVALSLMPRRGF